MGIGIPIVIFVVILALNVYAVSNLQFKAQSISDFSIFPDLNIDIDLEACNPTFFPASYKTIYFDVYYKRNVLGTATIHGAVIPAGTSVPTVGNIDLHSGSILGSVIDAIGSYIFGSGVSESDVKFVAKVDAPIFGVIPFSVEKHYSYNEFLNLLEGEENYGCQIQNPIPNIEQIQSQFESELSSLSSSLDDALKPIESEQEPPVIVKESTTPKIETVTPKIEKVQPPKEKEADSSYIAPYIANLDLSPWFPVLGDSMTIDGIVWFCTDYSEQAHVRVWYPNGDVYSDRKVSVNSDCRFETTILLPIFVSESNRGVWKVTAETPSTDETYTTFVFGYN